MLVRRSLYARVRIDPFDPRAKLDLVLQLVGLARLAALPTPAARRRAYARIPKGFSRVIRREMDKLIADISRGGQMKPERPNIELVADKCHAAWMASKRAAGITSRKSETGEELMVDYPDLSEPAKELDRGMVRAVYAAMDAADGVGE
jgi:hypothetical protein